MQDFIVEITRRPAGDQHIHARALAEIFNLSQDKAEALLRRLPGVVTKPLPEQVAASIARRFSDAGLEAQIKPSQPTAPHEPLPRRADAPAPMFTPPPTLPATAPATVPPATPPPATPRPTELSSAVVKVTGQVSSAHTPPAQTPLVQTPLVQTPPGQPRLSRTDSPVYARAPSPALDDSRSSQGRAARRRGGLLTKLLSLAILPTLLAILGALVVVWFVVRPALYEQLLESARNPAIATAASLSSSLRGEAQGAAQSLQLLETIQITRRTFPRNSISFIVATTPSGEPISGWFQQGQGFAAGSRALEEAIQAQAISAATRSAQGGRAQSGSFALTGGERIEMVAQPLLGADNSAIGTVVVGVTDRAVTQQVLRILLTTLLFSLIPLALAIVFAVARSRALTRGIVTLTNRADEISRGNLDARVDVVRSGDELEDLASALERMRISMQEAMTRLRRRRG